jgi:hypothetical protein
MFEGVIKKHDQEIQRSPRLNDKRSKPLSSALNQRKERALV